MRKFGIALLVLFGLAAVILAVAWRATRYISMAIDDDTEEDQ